MSGVENEAHHFVDRITRQQPASPPHLCTFDMYQCVFTHRTLIHSTVPWKGKHTKSDQELTVDVRGCETGLVSEVTA